MWVNRLETFLLGYFAEQGVTPMAMCRAFASKLTSKLPKLQEVLANGGLITLTPPAISDETNLAKKGVVSVVFPGVVVLLDDGKSNGAILHEVVMWFIGIQEEVKRTAADILEEADTESAPVLALANKIMEQPMEEAVHFAAIRYRKITSAAEQPRHNPTGICSRRYTVLKMWMDHFEGRVMENIDKMDQTQFISMLTENSRLPDSYPPIDPLKVASSASLDYELDEPLSIVPNTVLSEQLTRAGGNLDSDASSTAGSDA